MIFLASVRAADSWPLREGIPDLDTKIQGKYEKRRFGDKYA